MRELETDKNSFAGLGISLEEKAFYDILVSVRDKHQFDYDDEKCVVLAQKIKELVDTISGDWNIISAIKEKMKMDLILLLYQNGYPPQWEN